MKYSLRFSSLAASNGAINCRHVTWNERTRNEIILQSRVQDNRFEGETTERANEVSITV
jgi:hypothetical protein